MEHIVHGSKIWLFCMKLTYPNYPSETWAISPDTSMWLRSTDDGLKHRTFQIICSKVI